MDMDMVVVCGCSDPLYRHGVVGAFVVSVVCMEVGERGREEGMGARWWNMVRSSVIFPNESGREGRRSRRHLSYDV